jgi:multiple sugar transport system substrate-binding protein
MSQEKEKSSRRDFVKGAVTGLVVGAVATGAGAAAMWPTAAPPTGAVKTVTETVTQTATAAATAGPAPFSGKVTIALHSGHFEDPWRDWYTKPIKQELGIDISVVGIPVETMFDKLLLELSTGTGAYDLIQFNPAWYGDFVQYLVPLDDRYAKLADDLNQRPDTRAIATGDIAWGDIHAAFRERSNKFGGKIYTTHIDGDVIRLYYRADYLNDPTEQANFKAKYGYALAPPKTWDQYNDIAAFFIRDRGKTGKNNLYGIIEQRRRGRMYYWYLLRYLSYTPPGEGGLPHLFDPTNMKPMINSAEALQALASFKKSTDLCPPGVLDFEWDENFRGFMSGTAIMTLHWPDEGKRYKELTDPLGEHGSAILGSATPPGVVMKDGTLNWWSSAFGGWVMGIPSASKNIDGAYAVMKYMMSTDVSLRMVTDPNTGQDFFRYSHFFSPYVAAMGIPADYFTAGFDAISHLYPELRIPAGATYCDSLDLNLSKFLAGQETDKACLDTVASDWEKLTDTHGRDSQLKAYRAAMGLPAL